LAATELVVRPVRSADRDRVTEITRDVWEGRDYLPKVFDRWVSDAGASFQAAELDGVVVGVQRLRPYAPGLVWYEGLRVASSYRRRGVARAMLESAVVEFRQQGFREIRLATLDKPAMHLFESVRFRELVEVRWWRAQRMEGGEPARIPDAEDAGRLWPFVASSPGIDLYRGISPDLNGARDLNPAELERLARAGMLRLGPSGRAVALMREPWRINLAAALIAGRGAALRELLMALRFEADADSADHVTVNVPPGHPAEEDLSASGYDFDDAEANAHIYALKL
jgi:GNAT superfamily N-acetyltransferase